MHLQRLVKFSQERSNKALRLVGVVVYTYIAYNPSTPVAEASLGYMLKLCLKPVLSIRFSCL